MYFNWTSANLLAARVIQTVKITLTARVTSQSLFQMSRTVSTQHASLQSLRNAVTSNVTLATPQLAAQSGFAKTKSLEQKLLMPEESVRRPPSFPRHQVHANHHQHGRPLVNTVPAFTTVLVTVMQRARSVSSPTTLSVNLGTS